MYQCQINKKNIFILALFIMALFPTIEKTYASITSESKIDTQIPQKIPKEIIEDWKDYDAISTNYQLKINEIAKKLPMKYKEQIIDGKTEDAYIHACHIRRIARIEPYTDQIKKIIFARHYDLGGPIIGFLEGMDTDGYITNMGKWGGTPCKSKSPAYQPGAALCVLQFENYYPIFKELLKDENGVIKDPCVSFDLKKVVFAWSKDNNGFHIWEMEIDNTDNIRQLTNDPEGLKVSDIEPCYLQNSDILFNSSRCFGFVETYNNMTSNLFIMNKNGRFLRRIGFDQVHTFHPIVMDDGKILYSRWEYNDRNANSCMGLFTMNPDGTQQNEHFGNQTEWPATFIHARQIPGTQKIISIISEYSGPYAGDLVVIDPNEARNGLSAIQLIAPLRPNPELSLGGSELNMKEYHFQNPYPFDEEWFLVSWRKNNDEKYKIYFMSNTGERELIAWDEQQSLSQPISLVDRKACSIPPIPTYQTDYTKEKALVAVYNVYYGTGTGEAVENGTIKKIRVIALEYRTDPAFGNTGSKEFQMTPIGRWTSSWEAKRILGEIDVNKDGSASFDVPPRTPLYLQLIDENGCMIQTMRSWMTLQPGEEFICFGCHEDKNLAPPFEVAPLDKGPYPLKPFCDVDETGYFSYPQHIQPILDKNCVKSGCHNALHPILNLKGDKVWTGTLDSDNRNAFRFWNRSYINLTDPSKKYVSFIDMNTPTEGIKPGSVGSKKSRLLSILQNGHHEVKLNNEEFEKIAAWIDLCIPHSGTYTDDMRDEDAVKYLTRLERRKKHEKLEQDNIQEFIAAGGYAAYVGGNSIRKSEYMPSFSSVKGVTRLFTAWFNRANKQVLFHLPSEGEVVIVDLKGRLIGSLHISTDEYRIHAQPSIKLEVPAGIYIARFINDTVIEEQLVSVF